MVVRVLLLELALVAFTVLYGCGQASPPAERLEGDAGVEGPGAPSPPASEPATPSVDSASGTPVGGAFAEANFEPVGGSSAGGTALFKGVGSEGVQVDLSVSGLPSGDPDATYYAQVHEGSCSDERPDENGAAGAGPALALVRFGGLLAKAQEYAHGGEEHSIPEEPPGSIEQPMKLLSSADGSASVSTLLVDVQEKRLTSGGPKYVDLHSAESEDAPVLACGALKE